MDMFLLCLYLLGLCYLGYCTLMLSQPSNPPHLKWLDRFIFSFPLGIGLIIIPLFFANQFLQIPITRVSILIMTGGMVLMASGLRRKYSPNKNITFRYHPVKQMSQGFYTLWEKASALSTPEKYVGILITLTLTVGGCLILFFPMHSADVYIYHLPIAKVIFNTGFLPEPAGPGWVDATIPHSPLVFIYYGANWLVYGTVEYIIPKMSSFLFGILLLGVVYSIVRELLDSSKMAGLISILLSLEIQSFNRQLLQENIDFPVGFFSWQFLFCSTGFQTTEHQGVNTW